GTKPASSKRFKAVVGRNRGKWVVVDDRLEQTSFEPNVRLDFGDLAWKDYDFAVDVMRVAGNEQLCLLFRVHPGRGAPFYGPGHAGNTTYTMESQVAGNTKRLQPDIQRAIDQGKWHRMLARVRGKQGECFLDDTKLFDFASDDLLTGSVGLRTWATQYRFRN